MPVPTQEQIKQWRARWGSHDKPVDVQRLKEIVRIMQTTTNDYLVATKELIEYLRVNKTLEAMNITLSSDSFLTLEIRNSLEQFPFVPDLRGLNLELITIDERTLCNIEIPYWHLEGANLPDASFTSSYLQGTNFSGAILCRTDFKSCMMARTNMSACNLNEANLEKAQLFRANLSFSHITDANINKTDFSYASIEGANFKYSRISDEVDFSNVTFRMGLGKQFYRFRPNKYWYVFEARWRAYYYYEFMDNKWQNRFFNVLKKKLSLMIGKLRCTNFLNVSTRYIDWTGHRLLLRYIKDQQFLFEFKKNHRQLYFWWNLTSKCGQSVPRLFFWVILVISVFAGIYHNFDVVKLLEPDKIPRSWSALYTSVNIFSNLGMGDKDPLNKIGAILIMLETMLGFVALGLLLTVAGSRFARRS